MQILRYLLVWAIRNLLRFPLHNGIILLCITGSLGCFMAAGLIVEYLENVDSGFDGAERVYTINSYQLENPNPLVSGLPRTPDALARQLRLNYPELEAVSLETALPLEYEVATDDFTARSIIRFVGDEYLDIFPLPLLEGGVADIELGPDQALITEEEALRRFGTVDVVGRRMLVAHQVDVRVAGVLGAIDGPNHFRYLLPLMSSDMIMPLAVYERVQQQFRQRAGAESWNDQTHITYVKLAPDADIEEFSRRLAAFSDSVFEAESGRRKLRFVPAPLTEFAPSLLRTVLGSLDIRTVLNVIAVLVLLLGALNAANLSIAQLGHRSKEIAVHRIAGVGRLLLLLQFMMESAVLNLAALGCALAVVLLAMRTLPESGVDAALLLDAGLWARLLLAMMFMIAATSVFPLLKLSRRPLSEVLRQQGGASHSGRFRTWMAGAQFLISTIFLAFMVVVLMQNRLMQQDAGLARQSAVVALENVPGSAEKLSVLQSELESAPGILAVSRNSQLPFGTESLAGALSRYTEEDAPYVVVADNYIAEGYFRTMEQSLVAGRDFSAARERDRFPAPGELDYEQGPYPLVIDIETARRMGWSDPAEAVGELVYRPILPPHVPRRSLIRHEVVGVVAGPQLKVVDVGIGSGVYMLRPSTAHNLLVRLDPSALQTGLGSIATVWEQHFPGVTANPRFLDQLYDRVHRVFVLLGKIIVALALVASGIACIGIFGMASFITGSRSREIGIRKALGASRARVLRMLLLDFLRPVLVAVVLAWPLVSGLSAAYLSIFIHRSEPGLTAFMLALAVSLGFALLAVQGQARRSASLRPSIVLKYE